MAPRKAPRQDKAAPLTGSTTIVVTISTCPAHCSRGPVRSSRAPAPDARPPWMMPAPVTAAPATTMVQTKAATRTRAATSAIRTKSPHATSSHKSGLNSIARFCTIRRTFVRFFQVSSSTSSDSAMYRVWQ